MKKRLIITTLLLSLAITPFNMSTSIAAVTENTTAVLPSIQPYGNQTGYKYKLLNGKLYKRLWSYTYNRWEDPEWTLA